MEWPKIYDESFCVECKVYPKGDFDQNVRFTSSSFYVLKNNMVCLFNKCIKIEKFDTPPHLTSGRGI